ncbi:putative C6 transcription factor [Nemania sp. FL0031]|nr:putative C6 transcription factor [Nemania sp. FL0031]
MENSRPALGHSSTYGQACLQCYKAKCRCVPNANGNTCERCHRLKKRCQPSDSIRSRVSRKAADSESRIAQLEGRIETLISTMQSIVNSSGSTVQLDGLFNEENTTLSMTDARPNPTHTNSSIGDQLTPASDTTPAPPQDTISVSPLLSNTLPTQAKQSLDFFASRMLPSFPFISLTPDVTAEQLRRNRPFLFQAILTVTTFSTQRKLALTEELKNLFFTSALINVQSSVDLLLGTLTYLAWSTDAFLGRADIISRFMMLAISLVYDLRLFKPLQPDVQLFMAITQGGPCEYDPNAGEETVQGFMEKQRALLACFVLSSNVSSHLGRQDALRWTSQMEEACRLIEGNKSSSSDQAFAFQVRLHVLKQRAAHIREHQESGRDRVRTGGTSATGSIPGLLYLKSMRRQLREITSSIPADIDQRDTLNIHSQYVELYINQLAYTISSESPLLDTSGVNAGGVLPGFERLQCLWRSVECIKVWLDSFYKIPPSELVGLPFHFWSQMIQCTTILKYLSTLSDPDWDCQAVRNTVDLIATMDRMTQQLDMAAAEPGLQCDDSLLQLMSRLLSKCRAWANAFWSFTPPVSDIEVAPFESAETGSMGHREFIPDLDQLAWMQSMDLDNEEWLESVLGGSTIFS